MAKLYRSKMLPKGFQDLKGRLTATSTCHLRDIARTDMTESYREYAKSGSKNDGSLVELHADVILHVYGGSKDSFMVDLVRPLASRPDQRQVELLRSQSKAENKYTNKDLIDDQKGNRRNVPGDLRLADMQPPSLHFRAPAGTASPKRGIEMEACVRVENLIRASKVLLFSDVNTNKKKFLSKSNVDDYVFVPG
ncbi:hypothetical protein LTR86_009923 [Recurvomyces mirabilis]|nr:hypothetical protein LTR86_009923 [Recurvomyces mirabilis]